MLLIVAQVLAVIFAGLVISKSYLSMKQRREPLAMFLFWSLTWVAIVGFTMFPDIAISALGRQRVGTGTVLGVGLVFVYFILYRVYIKADRVEKELHRVVRELALKELKDKDS